MLRTGARPRWRSLPWLVVARIVAAAALRRRVPRARSRRLARWARAGRRGCIGLVAAAARVARPRVGLPDVWMRSRRIRWLRSPSSRRSRERVVAALPRRPASAGARPLDCRTPRRRRDHRRRSGRDGVALERSDQSDGAGELAVAGAAPPTSSRSRRSARGAARAGRRVLGHRAACSACSRRAGECTGGRMRDGWPCCSGCAPLALIPGLSPTHVPAVGSPWSSASAALFGLTATRLRRQYRIDQRGPPPGVSLRVASRSRAGGLSAGGGARPIVATRTLIERDYGPATVAAQQPTPHAHVWQLAQARNRSRAAPGSASAPRLADARRPARPRSSPGTRRCSRATA